jgi:hypothetical protein
MADVKISGLPASTTPLAGTEVLPIVQGGQTRQVSVDNLTAGRATSVLRALAQNGTESLPSYSFSNFPTQGFRTVNTNALLYGSGNSAIIFNAANSSITVSSDGSFGISSGRVDAAGADTVLARDAANTFAQRNSTNPQTFRLYSTYTNASNYIRNTLTWSGSVLYAKNEFAGTGSATLYVPVTGAVTVANLPSASTAGIGARAMVTDALAPTFGAAVTGGGAISIPVHSTGSAWNVG